MSAFAAILVAVAFAGGCGGDDVPRASTLPVRTVSVTGEGATVRVSVEIASTERQRQQGLMFRKALEEDRGMLFLFGGDQDGGFWMKDTYVPLTIAYLDAAGTVVALRDGVPLDTTILSPGAPYRYVLEVNRGWFERHGLGLGARVAIPEGLPAPEDG